VFVANYNSDVIAEFTTSGTTINVSLISGLDGPCGLAISPAPEPSANALAGLGAAMLTLWRRRK
jgi:MYXO-CTERM domain-containing protein